MRWICLLIAGCLIGCGNADMSGKVLLDKKPLVFGTVMVLGPDKLPRQCPIAEDGSYSVKDIPPGEVQVAVNTVDPKSMNKNLIRREGVDTKLYGNFDHIQGWFPIPPSYGDYKTSGLTYTLSRGGNAIDIEMKK
jgi:hypothetical protein